MDGFTFVGSVGAVGDAVGHQGGADATSFSAQAGELRR